MHAFSSTPPPPFPRRTSPASGPHASAAGRMPRPVPATKTVPAPVSPLPGPRAKTVPDPVSPPSLHPPLLLVPMGTANLMGQHLGLRWPAAHAEDRIAAAL